MTLRSTVLECVIVLLETIPWQCCAVLSCLVMSDDLPTPGSSVRMDSPGKNTGMGCQALLRIEPWSPALQANTLPSELPGKPIHQQCLLFWASPYSLCPLCVPLWEPDVTQMVSRTHKAQTSGKCLINSRPVAHGYLWVEKRLSWCPLELKIPYAKWRYMILFRCDFLFLIFKL